MICPICKLKMRAVRTIDSSMASLTIREYDCVKGHTFVSQEELLDEVEHLRDVLKKGGTDVKQTN